MDPSKITLTKEDIRRKLELLQELEVESREQIRLIKDAIRAASMDGVRESVVILKMRLGDEQLHWNNLMEDMVKLQASMVTASDYPGETSELGGHMRGHIEDRSEMPRVAGGEPYKALDPAETQPEGS